MASSAKSFFPTYYPSTSKKQSNSLWMNLFSKLANDGKLISDKYKKHFKNNLYLYCGVKDYKLNSYPQK